MLEELHKRLRACSLCPRRCGVDRTRGEQGFCGGGMLPRVASFHPHFGEEEILSGHRGSGTIFFSGCNMACVYCQNYTISHFREGVEVTAEDLAGMMLVLERRGCHNINLVTPTHFTPQIFEALFLARKRGLTVPLVYNTSGYEDLEVLRLLRGLVDIYLPDMRYSKEENAVRYSQAPRYPEVCREAIREMFAQVGNVVLDEEGVARRGLVVRILIIPSLEEEAKENLRFLATEISRDVFVTLLRQYRPVYRAQDFPEIDRFVSDRVYQEVLEYGRSLGLHNFILQ
ncbi:MAG: radical SAM protein [Candidatus Caldatribacterium sp.]|nr:radical SAM protein [Candidatus Caldatribacterium sp.]